MLDVQVSFVDAARAAGVRRVVKLSGIIADLDSPFRFARMHRGAERAVERSWRGHLRAGEFMPAYFHQIPNIVERGALMLPMADARIASIDVGDVAEVAVRVLTTDGHDGKVSVDWSGRARHDGGRAVADVRGRQAGPVRRRASRTGARGSARRRDAGIQRRCALRVVCRASCGKESVVYATVEQLLGRPPTSFAGFAARNASVFQGEAPK
jgi:hypothetical protein